MKPGPHECELSSLPDNSASENLNLPKFVFFAQRLTRLIVLDKLFPFLKKRWNHFETVSLLILVTRSPCGLKRFENIQQDSSKSDIYLDY